MKKNGTRAIYFLAFFGLILAAGVSAGQAYAYFTTYASADGRLQLGLGFTEIRTNDDVKNWTKTVSLENTGECDCYVRVKIFFGEKYKDYLTVESQVQGAWTEGQDGYWYYGDVVAPGSEHTTGNLLVKLDRNKLYAAGEIGDEESFNVIVVQECTAVLYDEDGSPKDPKTADWNILASGSQDSF